MDDSITAKDIGPATCNAPDGARDFAIFVNGEQVGEVTLVKKAFTGWESWGDSIDCWADSGAQGWIRETGDPSYMGGYDQVRITEIEVAADAAR